ncbi:MAG: endolytic transglycosylase MltG [Proteobacteria bacterium]|nr:MAG: endolytic transglycosylase MltG [Pseudomonadota bacterium]
MLGFSFCSHNTSIILRSGSQSLSALTRLFLLISIPILVGVSAFLFARHAFIVPLDSGNKSIVVVEVAPGKSFKQICSELKSKGVIRYAWALDMLARFRKEDTRVNAGEYELSPSMSPRSVLAKLVSGEVLRRPLTIREGVSIWEIGVLVEKAGILTAEDFNKALRDAGLLARAGIASSSFEGYLYPETYFFSRPITAEDIIWRMLEEGDRHWPQEFTDKADQVRLSRHEILTLASIIEKEAGNKEEMPKISSVFHNRLSQGMKLQSDPTVIYGLNNFNGDLTKDDLQNPHPWNTYTHFGLPPGPIANPSEAAIQAALFPEETTYLFFVADGSGGHVFSTTLQEHNEAVNKYQRSGAAAKRGESSAAAAAANPAAPSESTPAPSTAPAADGTH